MRRRRTQGGQAVAEFALLYGAVALPLTFMIIFVAEMLWIWHSVVDYTRDGARYAATHCWLADGGGGNVIDYMEAHVPPMIDMQQFQNGAAGLQVQYFAQNSDGTLSPFDGSSCATSLCVPDSVSVSVTAYQFLRFSSFFKLPPVTIPPFTATAPMENGGYSDATGVCTP